MKPTFFVFLFILIILSSYLLISLSPLRVRAESITVTATVDAHLSYRQEGQNLIISTNEPEGFTLITPNKTITKKGPVIFTVPASKSFTLVSGY